MLRAAHPFVDITYPFSHSRQPVADKGHLVQCYNWHFSHLPPFERYPGIQVEQ